MRVCASVVLVFSTVAATAAAVAAADGPVRKPLSSDQRAALIALMKAVDVAQDTDVVSPVDLPWAAEVLKATDIAYVPFRLTLASFPDALKSAAMYVRVVSRRDGHRSTEQTSSLRDWVVHGAHAPSRSPEMVAFNPGELPIGGPGVSSGRRSVQAPAEASAVLSMQQRQFEKEKAAAEEEKKRAESRDPTRFPFEEYYFFDAKNSVERAMTMPPGEYDVFVGLIDQSHVKTGTPTVVHHTITVPDFWNLELRLSDLMFVSDVRTLSAPLKPQQQVEHPYTWGRAEVLPVATPTFGRDEVLSVVYQICNYGAPDIDITAEYTFYRQVDGRRTAFNHTDPQHLTDDDLPPPAKWETQGFTMQRVPLKPFSPGDYELEVVVKDRLTRSTAKQSIAFTVK